MLRMLPKSSKYDVYRDRILAEYKKMMATLSAYQYDSGLWGQLIHPNQGDMWEETWSAMFTYAMILGVKNGWLDEKTYGTVARKGWLGIQNYLNTNFEIRTSAVEPEPARATHTTATGTNTLATCTDRRP